MDFDPNDAPRYLEGVEYPANKEELASAAEENGAPDELVERIRDPGQADLLRPGRGRGRARSLSNLGVIS